MKRKKPTPAVTAPPQIPDDLLAQLSDIQNITHCHAMLTQAYLPHSARAALDRALGFLQAAHAHAFKQAQKHPKASMIPDLGEQNGQT